MPAGSILSGIIGAGGASQAGSAAAAAGAKSYEEAQKWAQQLRYWNSPWIESGKSGLSTADALLGLGGLVWDGKSYQNSQTPQADQANALAKFKTSPDYQFRFQEGLNALDRSAASKGMLLSGAQTRRAQEYGGGLASGEYNNYFNKLMGMSGAGQQAEATTQGLGTNIVGQGLNALTQGNMAQASSYSNAANALASGISKGVSNLGSIVSFNPYGMFGNI